MISATGSVIIPMRLKNYGRNHKKRKEYSSKRAFYRALSLLISGLNLSFYDFVETGKNGVKS